MSVQINIIGAGHWGPNLIRNFNSLSGVAVGKVADLDPQRLAQVTARFPGICTTTSSKEAIEDPAADAVAIITPVSSHFELAKQALNAGKHVFLEKPLCSTIAQCDQLIALAKERKRVLMVGHVFLFNPGILKIKQILDSGALGRIFYVDAVRTNLGPIRSDVNALWDLAPHDFSIIDFWLGESAVSVSATGSRVNQGLLEDVVFASVKYRSGVIAHCHASWLNPRKVRQITVVGEKKMLVWDDIDPARVVQVYDHSFSLSENSFPDGFGNHRLQCFQGDLAIPRVTGEEPLLAECRHFVDCVTNDIPCRADGNSGREAVRILTAADQSIQENGRYIEINNL